VDDFGQDNDLEEILDVGLNPIHSNTRRRVASSRGQVRILDEDHEKTVMGEGDSIDTSILQPEHYVDCGHNPRGNPTSQCRCGAIVCRECLRTCLCGDPLCPRCAMTDPATGQTICRYCGDELSYLRRAAAVGRWFLSLFTNPEVRDGGRT
jgi:hypothetical protein